MDKTKKDIEKSILTYITDNVELPENIALGDAIQPGNSISYLMGAGSPGQRYFDGKRKKHYLFTISVKDSNSLEAIGLLNEIMDVMEIEGPNKLKSLSGSFNFVSSSMRNNPTYQGMVDDNGVKRSVISGSFEVTVII
jgi:hypothetical protein